MLNTSDNFCWSEWLKHAEDIPCAAYVIKNDEGLTLLGGNQSFYHLFGCSDQVIRQRYGGQLSALLDPEPFKTLPPISDTLPSKPVEVLQRLSRKGKDAWIITSFTAHSSDNEAVLYCASVDITDYETAMQSLISFEETVRIAAEQAHLDYMEYDFTTKAADIRSALSILPNSLEANDGLCPDFVKQMMSDEIICSGYESILQKAFEIPSGSEGRATYELLLKHQERGTIWTRLSIALKKNGKQAVVLWEDITQEKEAVRNYLSETLFYQAILSEKDAYGHIDATEDKITRVGGMWNLYNELIDQISYSQLIEEFIYKVVHPEDRKHYLEVMQRDNFLESFKNGINQLSCEFRRIVEQNKMVWMQLSIYLFRDPITNHVIGLLTIQNINEKKQQEWLLLRDSSIDQLTHVYNRRMAESLIRGCLAQIMPQEWSAFIILDIDNFKQINDQHGHHAGDQALMQLSDCLNHFFRHDDVVGRFGGDEFIIFLPNVTDKTCVTERINKLFLQIQENTADKLPLSCSAGIALFQGESTYELLFLKADRALYQAKSTGKGQFTFYQEDEPLRLDRRAPILREHAQSDDAVAGSPMGAPPQDDPLNVFLSDRMLPHANNNFDSLIGAQGDLAYLINPANFDLICGNQAFYDRLGMSASQCEGMKCYELMHRRDTPCPFCSKANWSTDKFYLWRNLNTALEQEFLIKNKLVTWQEHEALLAIAIDISNNKSIVDSLDNGVMETHNLLSGVQHMTETQSLTEAVTSALETIGYFFRADAVCFWQYSQTEQKYICFQSWYPNQRTHEQKKNTTAINQWLEDYSWGQAIMLESPEAMLSHSYDMYLYMKEHAIHNQRWMRIEENDELLGFIVIDNSSSNLQNIAFMESFTVFMASELKKRTLIENSIYAGQHDDLTDLLSRKSFEEFTLTYSPDEIACIGVMIANFNNLKGINSTRGFQTGNYYIRLFADMLRESFEGTYIYRLNGDEFLVLLPEHTRTDLEERISVLENLVQNNGMFTVSIGYSWDDVENDLSLLIEQATQAMKLHKKSHYDAMPNSIDMERRKSLNDLVTCIENREFEVFLQPKVELLHGTMVGAEALIRYHHKELGYITPSQFIDILEKNNLIRYIDLFVFEEVCRQLERWKNQGLFLPVVSLNFSRLTLIEQDILATMENIISHYDVPRKYLEIEITESVSNMGKSILYQNAQDLYKAGFAISLDDFGTKYTNLSILADLDFNILKVDRSLVGELNKQSSRQLIMKNIITMCQDLGIRVLAEGIENVDQESILQKLKCHLGQGYLYGKPMPIEEFDRKYIQLQQLT